MRDRYFDMETVFGLKYKSDDKLQEFAKKFGVTGLYREVMKKKGLLGVNFGKQWRDHLMDVFRKHLETHTYFGPKPNDDVINHHVDAYIENLLREDFFIPEGTIDKLVKAIREGGEYAFVGANAEKVTAIHEIMHTFTGKELKPYGSKFEVPISKVRALEIEANLEYGTYPPEWIRRPSEFITEVMAQYFVGNIRPGTELRQLAETVLRNSDKPEIRALIGTTIGLAMVLKDMGDQNGRRTRSSGQ